MIARLRLRYRIRDEPGIIPHIYASERENPAMFEADGSGLQAVTLAWLFASKAAQRSAMYYMRRRNFQGFVKVISVEANPIAPTYPVRLAGWPVREMDPKTPMFVKRSYCEEEF